MPKGRRTALDPADTRLALSTTRTRTSLDNRHNRSPQRYQSGLSGNDVRLLPRPFGAVAGGYFSSEPPRGYAASLAARHISRRTVRMADWCVLETSSPSGLCHVFG